MDNLINAFEKKQLFITGNSRSGTTMMMRIMNNHRQIHSINEPHFFEKLWSPDDKGKRINHDEAYKLLSKLFTGQRKGFFEKLDTTSFQQDCKQIIERNTESLTRLNLYADFLHYETEQNGKQIPCEKTPQNVFYIKEILEAFPNALIINMVRDPRGVMLSQKKKWKRKFLGGTFIPYKEVLRLRINYHPITISRLWRASIKAVEPFSEHPQVINVQFEHLLNQPKETISRVCEVAKIDFDPSMLEIDQAGSSSMKDQSKEKGIRANRAFSWENGLSKSEIAICERINETQMTQFGYPLKKAGANWFGVMFLYITFPFKLGLAFLFNLRRMRNIKDTIKRRLK